MDWNPIFSPNRLQYELDTPDAVAKCKVIQLASGDWQGRLEWLEGGEKRVMHTEPYESDFDAISATEKLLTKLELEIEGAPVVDTKETQVKGLWLPESESCYRPSLELVGGVAEIVRNSRGKFYGAVAVEGYVYTTQIYEEFSDARIETEKLMAAHGVMFATHNPHDDTEAPKQTRFAILTKASHALERGVEKHGKPETSFACIRRLWNAYLQNRPNPEAPLVDSEVADLMELMKVGRGQVQPQIDDYIDRAGYAALAGELAVQKGRVQ